MTSEQDNPSQKHFHFRWPETLDWESFKTREEASAMANELVRPSETYQIEMFDGQCPVCRNLKSAVVGARGETRSSSH